MNGLGYDRPLFLMELENLFSKKSTKEIKKPRCCGRYYCIICNDTEIIQPVKSLEEEITASASTSSSSEITAEVAKVVIDVIGLDENGNENPKIKLPQCLRPVIKSGSNDEMKSFEGVCINCFKQHIQIQLSDSFHGVCKPIKCICGDHILHMNVWEAALNDAGGLNMKQKYIKLAKTALWIHCGGCGSNGSLLSPQLNEKTGTPMEIASKAAFSFGYEPWVVKAAEFVERFENKVYPNKDDFNLIYGFVKTMLGEQRAGLVNEVMNRLRDMIYDPERRLRYQLLQMKIISPLVPTLCCQRAHCFFCKVKDGHHGMSCEQYQAKKSEEDLIVMCNSCGIMLVKGDGCSSVSCVCGSVLNWSEKIAEVKRLRMADVANELIKNELSHLSLAQIAQYSNYSLRQGNQGTQLLHPNMSHETLSNWRSSNAVIINRANTMSVIGKACAMKAQSLPSYMSDSWRTYVGDRFKEMKMSKEEVAYYTMITNWPGYGDMLRQPSEDAKTWLQSNDDEYQFARKMRQTRRDAARMASKFLSRSKASASEIGNSKDTDESDTSSFSSASTGNVSASM